MSPLPIPLREVRVRPVRADEVPRWNDTLRQQHYLGFRKLCGCQLKQVAVQGQRWLALLGWQAAALHSGPRDRWIGWSPLQRRTRLFLLANQSRFLLLPRAGSQPGLASRVLGLSLRRLPRDWQQSYAPPLCWSRCLSIRSASAGPATTLPTGSSWDLPAASGACARAPQLPPPRAAQDRLRLPLAARRARAAGGAPPAPRLATGKESDPLDSQATRIAVEPLARHPGLPQAARLAASAGDGAGDRAGGAPERQEERDRIWIFGRKLTQKQLARAGARRNPTSGQRVAPSLNTIRRVLAGVDQQQVEAELDAWLQQQAGQVEPGEALALDGKWLRGSYDRDRQPDGELADEPPRQQLTVVGLDTRQVYAQVGFTGKKEDAEAKAGRAALERIDLLGRVIVFDALHTQRATVEQIIAAGATTWRR